MLKEYKIGPLFTPPIVTGTGGLRGTLQIPAAQGAALWQGAAFDPETNMLYVPSVTNMTVNALQPGEGRSDMNFIGGGGGGGRGLEPDAPGRAGGARGATPGAPAAAGTPAAPAARGGGGGRGGGRGGGAGTPVLGPGVGRGPWGIGPQGLPLVKPPYGRITAYNMNTGDIVWQKTHSSTPDDIRNHPALKGLNLPRLGQPGRTFIGVLTTKNLVIAGEGGVHTNEAGRRVALLRAYDQRTGQDAGGVDMPAKQTGSPMSYQINGKQYIVLAVSGNDGAELLACALP
jgi:quinoprotein glucose dehydrogenase